MPLRSRRALLPDAVGVLWVLAADFVLTMPQIVHGIYPGYSWDELTELVPWSTVTWLQVHHGHLPLWNPYSALGTPLAFNWQSSPFSLTTVAGYLLPVHWSYTGSVLLDAMLAGTGAYVFGRVLRLGVLGSVMAATVFELCGSFAFLLGWPAATVMAWFGWLLTGIVLVIRGGRRVRRIAFLAFVVSQTVYAGQPDMLVALAFATLLFVLALFVARALYSGFREQFRPAIDLVAAVLTGAALSAPLLLPGLQLAQRSIHANNIRTTVPAPQAVLNVIFTDFAPPLTQPPSLFYVGLIGTALALVGIVIRWRHVEVSALAAMTLVLAGLAFIPHVFSYLRKSPWWRQRSVGQAH